MSYESNQIYKEKFQEIHHLLKEHGCKATYPDEHEEFYNSAWNSGSFFYASLKEMEVDSRIKKEWKEEISGTIDVIITTKIKKAELEELRVDLEYSYKVGKYSMYISLPTKSKSISLSKDMYTNQDDVIGEIQKWISYCKCKKVKEKKANIRMDHMQQLSLF